MSEKIEKFNTTDLVTFKAITVTVAVISIFFLNEERQFVENLLVLLSE